ncbi:MAG: DUF2281 domain-containing protein [Desulfobacteraceae bacterium]|nr:MAG: DUF2281 domain-containing protein [Desulfobacteraceae bacterium]
MKAENIAREISTLPPEAQKQILDFMAFLKARYPTVVAAKKVRRAKLSNEPFVGMWRTRRDMQNSADWVRNLRRNEWERS